MMLRALTVGLALVALVGCADTDEDGLTDAREKRLGSDPLLADSDGDLIDDGAEVEQGLDPINPDSDGDTYLDGHELIEDRDPADPESRIYFGGWPYNPNKDAIDDPGLGFKAVKGKNLGRFKGVDQFGEEVDIYDFAGHGKPILLDLSAEWCPPCNDMAAWLDGEKWPGMEPFEPVREAVANGDIFWITALSENKYGKSGEQALEVAVVDWHDEYPHPRIPVLADVDKELAVYMRVGGWPSIYLIDENMVYQVQAGDYLPGDAMVAALGWVNENVE